MVNLTAGLQRNPKGTRLMPIGQFSPRVEQASHFAKLLRNSECIRPTPIGQPAEWLPRGDVTTKPKGYKASSYWVGSPEVAGVPTTGTSVSINMHINHNNYNNRSYKSKYIQVHNQLSYHRQDGSTDTNTNPQIQIQIHKHTITPIPKIIIFTCRSGEAHK